LAFIAISFTICSANRHKFSGADARRLDRFALALADYNDICAPSQTRIGVRFIVRAADWIEFASAPAWLRSRFLGFFNLTFVFIINLDQGASSSARIGVSATILSTDRSILQSANAVGFDIRSLAFAFSSNIDFGAFGSAGVAVGFPILSTNWSQFSCANAWLWLNPTLAIGDNGDWLAFRHASIWVSPSIWTTDRFEFLGANAGRWFYAFASSIFKVDFGTLSQTAIIVGLVVNSADRLDNLRTDAWRLGIFAFALVSHFNTKAFCKALVHVGESVRATNWSLSVVTHITWGFCFTLSLDEVLDAATLSTAGIRVGASILSANWLVDFSAHARFSRRLAFAAILNGNFRTMCKTFVFVGLVVQSANRSINRFAKASLRFWLRPASALVCDFNFAAVGHTEIAIGNIVNTTNWNNVVAASAVFVARTHSSVSNRDVPTVRDARVSVGNTVFTADRSINHGTLTELGPTAFTAVKNQHATASGEAFVEESIAIGAAHRVACSRTPSHWRLLRRRSVVLVNIDGGHRPNQSEQDENFAKSLIFLHYKNALSLILSLSHFSKFE
jgi:hypothetical protein